MVKEIISTSNAPKALGPYSQAVKIDKSLYISGQIAIDPKTGDIPEGIEAQTHQIFSNIKAILDSVGFSLSDVVSCDVYMKNLKDFPLMNKIYAEIFDPFCNKSGYPSRATVEVSNIPKGALLEIKTIAIKK
ncbi:RidA family protein [Promethearchaeum syntrophicum]|uniref:RidA family protein n=1 Tax=Promethearchaeum syntrophicum TaxID=2594042 RepID=A0A5B9D8Q9_9ARCH|nr:Rid family detoxifying hydrolase [Candidatus Prometheoarchaeum syntrophicum]QEE15160.1 Enamine/imine deaminase [Candidatus Prometheoarchaeum syntrophicum]